ncbi:hypothetical protein Y032_0004g2003 [Ancylostoma ceylanicum]|uniref:Uncharacterized protein n=1 Tax=Ancylostoma ceylanicum TaxID=53326 RepID=A0A016VVX3_9BILA|nr:hypothetical protein Y032_0004g2003 [Ancylostoma ceylanicum]
MKDYEEPLKKIQVASDAEDVMKRTKHGIGVCFSLGRIDCVPRADVVFIRFHSQPDDPWAIDQIDVNLFFLVDRGGRQPYNWHFEHAVLMPCSSWLKETHMYQIGPRNGLFIEHPYLYMPKPGEWVRDWV